MLCPHCQQEARRFGTNRNGSQRWQCLACNRTFTPREPRPLGNMRIEPEKAIMCLRMLMEGTSIRSVERLTGVHRNTIMSLVVTVGLRCATFLEDRIKNVPVRDVQADEIWSFVGMKEKTRERLSCGDDKGDAWTFVAIERTTKLVLCWHLGKRDTFHTGVFAEKLRDATSGRFQLTTDGYRPYLTNVPRAFGHDIDFATLVKVYASPRQEGQERYSPGEVIDTVATTCCGTPDPDRICTSHVERSNLTVRMTIRRLTRLTSAFSKKWEHHESALALYFVFYNWCRPHMTLTASNERAKTTPAMEAGLTDHVWTMGELLMEMAAGSTHS